MFQGVRVRGPRYLIRDRDAGRVGAIVAITVRCTMGRAGWVVLAASIAVEWVTLAGITLLL